MMSKDTDINIAQLNSVANQEEQAKKDFEPMHRRLQAKFALLFRGSKISNRSDTSGWPPGEIKVGQEESYATWLKGVIHKRKLITNHLTECCQYDLVRKFKIICKVMNEEGNGWDLEIFPEVRSCLIYAASCKSIGVCDIILANSTKEYLMAAVDAHADYLGCTAVHVMVVNEMVEMLQRYMKRLDRVDRLVMLDTHLEGKHFLKTMKVSSLPLHLACWSGNKDTFVLLLSYGADLDAKDSNGNTVLHVLADLGNENLDLARQMFTTVLTSDASQKWYSLKNELDLHHWTAQDDIDLKKYMLYIENNDGYTPLTWAANYLNRDMVEFILNIEGVYRLTAWRFGRPSFVRYDMTEVDPVVSARQRPSKPNVLELITYRAVLNSVPTCFSIPPVEHLVEYKWKHHSLNFFSWAIFHVAVMVLCYLVPVTIIKDLRDPVVNSTNTTAVPSEKVVAMDLVKNSLSLQLMIGFILFNVLTNIFVETVTWAHSVLMFVMISTRRWHGRFYEAPFTVIWKSDVYRIAFNIFNICEVIAMVALLWHSTINSFTAVAFITGCYFLLYFLQGFRMTSYFGTLIHIVIFTDLISFAFVFFIMLVGFGGTIMMVVYDPLKPIPGFDSLQASTFSMFQLMAGVGVFDSLSDAKNQDIVTAVFVLFVCLTVILLLNMLIAAMSETYAAKARYRREIWIRNRASVMMMFENFSLAVAIRFKMGKYLTYEAENDRYTLLVETSVPASCV